MLESALNFLRLLIMEMLLKSLLLFLTAGIALVILRRASASARSLVWRLTLFGLLILPAMSMILPALPISLSFAGNTIPRPLSSIVTDMQIQPAKTVTEKEDSVASYASPASEPESGMPELQVQTRSDITPARNTDFRQATHDVHPAVSLSRFFASARRHSALLLTAIWLAGCLLLLLKLLAGLLTLRRMESKAVQAQGSLQPACDTLAIEMGILRPVRVLVASAEQAEVSPMTWGFLRLLIVLPKNAEDWPEQRLRAALLHELAHIVRHDWIVQILAEFVRSFYWFHPLAWLMARQLRRESEQACDDRVLCCGMKASDYAAHLLEIVHMRKSTIALPCAAISMAQPSLLETRLRALLNTRRSHRPLTQGVALLSLLALVLVVVPLAAARVATHHAPAILNQPAISLQENSPIEAPVSSEPTSSLPAASLPLTGLAAAAFPVLRQPSHDAIAWGKSDHGLQAGLEIVGGRTSVIIGQHVEFIVHLRNVGKKPLTLEYPAIKEKVTANPFVWNATTQNEKSVLIYRENTSIDSAKTTTITLQPGETQALPGDAMRFHTSTMGNTAAIEQTVYLVPGAITVQAVPFPIARYRNDWLKKVTTGIVRLDVTASPAGADIVAMSETAEPKVPAGLTGIHWGMPEKGLEAGIRIEGKTRRYAEGQTVRVTTFVRNTTNRGLPFAYAYRPPRVWDSSGKQIENSRNEGLAAGLPGATLLVLPPGETLALPSEIKIIVAVEDADSVYSSHVAPAAGKYRVGQMFQIPWSELKNTEDILAKNDPIYRTHVTLLNAKGQPYTVRAVITGADGVGISWNRDHAPTPDIGAAKSDAGTLWTGFDEFDVTGKEGAAVNAIQWGKGSDDLQAGIRIPGAQKRFNPGGRVPLECYIRNTSEHDIAFTYTALYYSEQLPAVIDTAHPGEMKTVKGVLLTGINAALTLILKAGETVVFPHVGVGLGEKQEKVPEPNKIPKGLEQYPYLEEPTPGSYQIKQTFVYNLTTVEKARDLMARSHNKPVVIEPMAVKLIKRDRTTYDGEVTVIPAYELKSVLETGAAPFEILDKNAAAAK